MKIAPQPRLFTFIPTWKEIRDALILARKNNNYVGGDYYQHLRSLLLQANAEEPDSFAQKLDMVAKYFANNPEKKAVLELLDRALKDKTPQVLPQAAFSIKAPHPSAEGAVLSIAPINLALISSKQSQVKLGAQEFPAPKNTVLTISDKMIADALIDLANPDDPDARLNYFKSLARMTPPLRIGGIMSYLATTSSDEKTMESYRKNLEDNLGATAVEYETIYEALSTNNYRNLTSLLKQIFREPNWKDKIITFMAEQNLEDSKGHELLEILTIAECEIEDRLRRNELFRRQFQTRYDGSKALNLGLESHEEIFDYGLFDMLIDQISNTALSAHEKALNWNPQDFKEEFDYLTSLIESNVQSQNLWKIKPYVQRLLMEKDISYKEETLEQILDKALDVVAHRKLSAYAAAQQQPQPSPSASAHVPLSSRAAEICELP
jgi:hypothetical protein